MRAMREQATGESVGKSGLRERVGESGESRTRERASHARARGEQDAREQEESKWRRGERPFRSFHVFLRGKRHGASRSDITRVAIRLARATALVITLREVRCGKERSR